MKIAFMGDIHGRIFHAIAAVTMWQIKKEQKLDMIIQVGDFGAYPSPDEIMLNNKFIREDPTELDFSKYIKADLKLQDDLKYIRQKFICPIHFIRGNHEDFEWLNIISEHDSKIAPVDKIDLIHYIPDGAIIDFHGVRVAFLGGVETNAEDAKSIKDRAYNNLIKNKPGSIDILVTHDSPYGTGISYTGEVQGSKKVTELLKALKPRYLIAGHYHHVIGPQSIEKTQYLGLNTLIPPIRKDKTRSIQQGSIAILDTCEDTLELVSDEWLTEINKDFTFESFVQKLKASER